MTSYSYADCLEKSYRVNWRVADVLGDRRFDHSRAWLPPQISASSRVTCLSPAEKVKLSHVEMGAYAHLFGYVEEFIAPKVVELARDVEPTDRHAFHALANFAAEEVKHMTLFRELRARVDEALGFPLALLPDARDVARAVLTRDTGAVLLLTAAIEWFTQHHYLACFEKDDALDPFTRHIFRSHWLEESQHARMDHLETLRTFEGMPADRRDRAIDDLIELVAAVHGLLEQQAAHDVDNLERYLDRTLSAADRREVQRAVMAAKRHAFIESGVTHPNFQELFGMVTTAEQQARVQSALGAVLAPSP